MPAKPVDKKTSTKAKPKTKPKAKVHVHSGDLHGKVDDRFTLEKLRDIARTRGIQWGGLSKAKLIKKINNYYR